MGLNSRWAAISVAIINVKNFILNGFIYNLLFKRCKPSLRRSCLKLRTLILMYSWTKYCRPTIPRKYGTATSLYPNDICKVVVQMSLSVKKSMHYLWFQSIRILDGTSPNECTKCWSTRSSYWMELLLIKELTTKVSVSVYLEKCEKLTNYSCHEVINVYKNYLWNLDIASVTK